jgi:glycosyltransferase involved in cell wall biosynthesis
MAERKSSRNAAMTVFVCAYDKDLADKWNLLPEGGKHAIVYNGIVGEAIPQKSVTRPNVVGFLGRLTFQKDPLLFLEIARILASEGYLAKIIGGGELENDVRRFVYRYGLNDQVSLLGVLPHSEALTAISDVGCMVLTSRWEGLPIAVLEAMYMGVPVVAAHVSGTAEIIENGVSGILIRDRDPRQYVDAILRITRDLDYRSNLMDAAKKVIEERFTQERVTEEYMHLYNSVTKC